jgi:hypothetical protein
MRKALVPALTMLALSSLLCAQGEARLTDWTYRSDNRPLTQDWVDKTGHMLADGDLKGRVIYAGGQIVIDIALPQRSELRGVAVHVSRPNMNYKLRDWRVQANIFGDWRDLGQAPGFWGDTTEREFRLQIPNLQATTDRVRLVFNTASILSISEIELLGQAATQQAGTQITLPLVADPKPSAREADVDNDQKPEVILENDLVRLIFFPNAGGVCRSLLYKPANQEYVGTDNSRYGALRDQLWAPPYMFADRPYAWQTGGDANGAWVELSVTGAGGMMNFTTLTKRIEITRGSPVVRVHYRLLNDPSSMTDYTYGFWVHNFLGTPGQAMRYFYPTEEGVKELAFPLPKGEKQADYWYRNPARGWTAVCGENGNGLAATVDFKYLNLFYNWAGVGMPTPTHEWRYNRIPLKSGQAFETNVVLMPFAGTKRVDGVVEDVIGSIEVGATSATVRLVPASPEAKLAFGMIRLKHLPDGAWGDPSKIEMIGGKPAQEVFSFGTLAPGAYLLNVQIQRGGGKTLDDFERPFSVGGAQIAYERKPVEERVGLGAEAKAGLPRHDLSDEIVTPHVPWADPLPGGPIKALVLCDDFAAREVIELKQRLQMDLTYVKFRTTFWKEDLYCGDRSISTPEQANARLQEALKGSKFDVIILSGFNWNVHFTPATQQALMAQVKAGTGLILIEPDGFKEGDELAPIAGIARTRVYSAYSKWQRGEQSPLTAGLPWDILPVTRYMDYTKWPEGKVLATLDKGQPLLVTNSFGAGRTAVLTYDTLTHDMSYRGYAGIIPIFSYRGGFLRPEYADMTWKYWEPYYALLTRLSAWAAKRDSGVEVVSLEPLAKHEYGAPAMLPLRLSGGTGTYAVTADYEDRQGRPVQQVKATYTAGQAQTDIPVPAYLPAGLNLVHVIVKDKAGGHVAWAQTTVQGAAPLSVKALTPEKKTTFGTRAPRQGQLFEAGFAPGEPLKLTVALDGTAPLAAGYSVRARLYDTHRRLLFEETRPVQNPGEEVFTASPPELRSQGLQWEVATMGPQGQTDLAISRVVCGAPRDWDHFRLTSWGGIFPWRSEYLFEALAPRVESLVDVSFSGTTENSTGKTWLELWHNIGYSHLGLLGYMGKDTADFMEKSFSEKATKFAQTHDKQYLIRTPSLADKEWRGRVMAHMVKSATEDRQFGSPYDYCMGDEMSLTHYTRYFDFDFDPRNLADFREWLKLRHASLDDLNAAWETTFTTWEEVMPMTLEEARQRTNAAPWAEFRTFMNDSMAGFCAEVQKSLASVDPQVRAGLSGTQEPRAGNGMDWWKMSQGFNYYHAYNTGWSNEMRRSFAPYTGVQQSPYYAGYWQAGRQIEYNMFWCLLHDTEAISAWATTIFFYNDFTYSESGRDTMALCHEFKRGLWDLIRSGQWQHDGIAIHYSQDAINAAQLAAKEEEHKDVRDVWVKLIEDQGLQYNFVSTEQIEGGILTKPKNDFERYKVLILPEALAITGKERTALEEFVKGGGVVIGDFNIGLYDGLCRKQQTGMLDALFGVRREGTADTALNLEVSLAGAEAKGVKLPVAEGLQPGEARSFAQTAGEAKSPALFGRPLGKGMAWYLNLDLRQYDDERTFHTAGEKQIRAILGAILSRAGVKPYCDISFASGQAPNIEVTRHRAGDLLFLGFQRGGGGSDEVATIKLPSAAHVYDCRTGEALGKRAEIRATFAGQQARVYCLSPEALAAPTLAVKSAGAKPGEAVGYTIGLKGGNDRRRQVVRLMVLGPDGREYGDYERNVIVGSKPATGSFRLALNDGAGTWRLLARDVCSGETAEARVTVK